MLPKKMGTLVFTFHIEDPNLSTQMLYKWQYFELRCALTFPSPLRLNVRKMFKIDFDHRRRQKSRFASRLKIFPFIVSVDIIGFSM